MTPRSGSARPLDSPEAGEISLGLVSLLVDHQAAVFQPIRSSFSSAGGSAQIERTVKPFGNDFAPIESVTTTWLEAPVRTR